MEDRAINPESQVRPSATEYGVVQKSREKSFLVGLVAIHRSLPHYLGKKNPLLCSRIKHLRKSRLKPQGVLEGCVFLSGGSELSHEARVPPASLSLGSAFSE